MGSRIYMILLHIMKTSGQYNIRTFFILVDFLIKILRNALYEIKLISNENDLFLNLPIPYC